MSKIILCDLDGTLCNLTHRVAFVKHKPSNWPAFKAAIPFDNPIEQTIYLIKLLYDAGDTIIIVTARGEECLTDTVDWLVRHGIKYHHIYMRGLNDNRDDVIVKREMLNLIRKECGEPFMVFDDRPKVGRMFVEEGVHLFDVGQKCEDF